MNKEIPRWADRATVQFIPQLVSNPSVRVQFKLPRDSEELTEILNSWHERKTGAEPSRFTFNELQEINPAYPLDRALRQVSIDLRTVLFIEIFYYGVMKNVEPG